MAVLLCVCVSVLTHGRVAVAAQALHALQRVRAAAAAERGALVRYFMAREASSRYHALIHDTRDEFTRIREVFRRRRQKLVEEATGTRAAAVGGGAGGDSASTNGAAAGSGEAGANTGAQPGDAMAWVTPATFGSFGERITSGSWVTAEALARAAVTQLAEHSAKRAQDGSAAVPGDTSAATSPPAIPTPPPATAT